MDMIDHSSSRSLNNGTFWSNLQGGLRVLLVQYFLFYFHESGSESEAFLFSRIDWVCYILYIVDLFNFLNKIDFFNELKDKIIWISNATQTGKKWPKN